jgi:hypothetical protein
VKVVIAVAARSSLLAGCGAAARGSGHRPLAKKLMTKRLNASHLDYKWVACVSVGRTYRHVPITRCNVDFGIDPHVEGYCLLLEGGKLVTNHEDSAIPCKHDDAGWDRTTITNS